MVYRMLYAKFDASSLCNSWALCVHTNTNSTFCRFPEYFLIHSTLMCTKIAKISCISCWLVDECLTGQLNEWIHEWMNENEHEQGVIIQQVASPTERQRDDTLTMTWHVLLMYLSYVTRDTRHEALVTGRMCNTPRPRQPTGSHKCWHADCDWCARSWRSTTSTSTSHHDDDDDDNSANSCPSRAELSKLGANCTAYRGRHLSADYQTVHTRLEKKKKT